MKEAVKFEEAIPAPPPPALASGDKGNGKQGGLNCTSLWASLVAQMVKNPPAMRETWVQSLGWEDPLGKGTAAHSSILAWSIA